MVSSTYPFSTLASITTHLVNYRIAPYFRGTQILWFSYFLQNTNFRNNNFRECVTTCMESARLLDFRE